MTIKYGPRPSGRILAHNHVRRSADMPQGLNGFRYWYDKPQRADYVVCKCGWRPDLGTHYRIEGMGSADYRCETL
jgi:hypothetical protein